MAFSNRPQLVQSAVLSQPIPSTVGDGVASLQAQLDALRAENDALRQQRSQGGPLHLKIGEKGGVMVIGLGRFPTTLYQEQWEKLIAFTPQITAFIRANAHKLSRKPV